MQVLAINQNATIERLVSLSSGKMGYNLRQFPDANSAEPDHYDFVIIDSELYSDGDLSTLKTVAQNAIFILITSKNKEKPDGFDIYLEKPFLPTELVDIYAREQANIASQKLQATDSSDDDNDNDIVDLDSHEEFAMPSFDSGSDDLAPLPSFDNDTDAHDLGFDVPVVADDEFTFDLDSVLDKDNEAHEDILETTISDFNFDDIGSTASSEDFNFETNDDDFLQKLDDASPDLPQDALDTDEFDFASELALSNDNDLDAQEFKFDDLDDNKDLSFDDILTPSVDDSDEFKFDEEDLPLSDEEFKFDDLDNTAAVLEEEPAMEFKFDEEMDSSEDLFADVEEFKFDDDIKIDDLNDATLLLEEPTEEFKFDDDIKIDDLNDATLLLEEPTEEFKF
ncbi:MAG: hypothetical protein RL154_124, partial [Pseudomonadota bacterium]